MSWNTTTGVPLENQLMFWASLCINHKTANITENFHQFLDTYPSISVSIGPCKQGMENDDCLIQIPNEYSLKKENQINVFLCEADTWNGKLKFESVSAQMRKLYWNGYILKP